METNLAQLIRKINCFKDISKEGLDLILKNCNLESYNLGMKICDDGIIPDKISFVLEGKVRAFYKDKNEIFTIEKGDFGYPIGIISHLIDQGCENIVASSNIKIFSISDEIFYKLYKKEYYLRKIINKKIYGCEIATLISKIDIQILKKNSTEDNYIKLKKQFKLGGKNSSKNNIFLCSSNNSEFRIGEIVNNNNLTIDSKNIFPVRILNIENFNTKEFKNKSNTNENKNNISKSYEFKNGEYPFNSYINDDEINNFKNDYKGLDSSDEILNLVEIICRKFSVSFRKDSVSKFIRDEISKGRIINLDFYADIFIICEILVGYTKVRKNSLNRLPFSLIEIENNIYLVNKTFPKEIEIYNSSDGLTRLNLDKIKSDNEKEYSVLILRKKNNSPQNLFNFKWFIPLIIKNKNTLIQILISSFIIQIFTLANPLLIQVIIDKVISQRSLDSLQVLGITLFIVTVLEGILKLSRTYIFNDTSNKIDINVGSEVINHLIRLPSDYFDRRPVGELSTRLAELEKIRDFFTGQVVTTIIDTLFSIIYIFILFLYSWLLTLISLSVIPIQILITLLGGPLYKYQHRETTKLNAKTQNHLIEAISGIQNVKTQNIENFIGNRWQKNYSKYIGKSFQKNILGSTISESSQFLQKISQLLIIWIGSGLVINGQLSLGQLIAFRIISGYVVQPILRLSTLWQRIEELKISFERLADIMDRKNESESSTNLVIMPKLKGEIAYSNVNFSFSESDKNIIKNINLNFNANAINGIVGQSGSGKSTLVKLLSRLYIPTEGKILVDGYDINKVDINSYRKQIGVVMQDPYLFNGTISENISISNKSAAIEEIVAAAKFACAHDFIMEQNRGYDTNIGEKGALLSGGQRQRIALARAILTKPKILILDEATSALDFLTEKKIISNLGTFFKKTTIIFISHRIDSLKIAQKIIYLENGSIVEEGNYKELISNKGHFYALSKLKYND